MKHPTVPYPLWREYQKICKHRWFLPYIGAKKQTCSLCGKGRPIGEAMAEEFVEGLRKATKGGE